MGFGGLYDPNRMPGPKTGGLRTSNRGLSSDAKVRTQRRFAWSAVAVGLVVATVIIIMFLR